MSINNTLNKVNKKILELKTYFLPTVDFIIFTNFLYKSFLLCKNILYIF